MRIFLSLLIFCQLAQGTVLNCFSALAPESQANQVKWQKMAAVMAESKKNGLQTERLTLKPLDPKDEEALVKIIKDGSAGLYPTAPKSDQIESAAWASKDVDHMLLESAGTHFAIYETESQRCIGYIAFFYGPVENQYSTTYAIAKDAQGKGYASEALTAVLNVYREHSDKSIPFIAHVKSNNKASMGVLSKAGLVPSEDKIIKSKGKTITLKSFKLPE